MRSFDVVVIGAGPAGEVAAGRLADGGLEVAIAERELVGGECSYWACMPSKALLRPAEALAEARRVPGAAQAITGELDVAAVLARRDEIIHDEDDDAQLPWLADKGITLLRGEAVLTGERTLEIAGEPVEARKAVVIATGSRPRMPPIVGLDSIEDVWTNRQATTARSAPEKLVILGGGPVGAEMAQAWRTLGSEVTLIEPGPAVLSKEEPFAREQVLDALTDIGVDVRLNTEATKVEQAGDGVRLTLNGGSTLLASKLLVAAGRTPNSDELGLEPFGVEGGKPIEVDEHLQVPGHPWLYAIGDVNGRDLLTHMGKYQARIVGDHILGRPNGTLNPIVDGSPPPRVTFTDPQVAAVGHTLQSAQDAGIDAKAVDVPTSGNAGGSYYGRGAAGTARLVVDQARGVVVGATITGAEIADFLQAATIAVVGQVPLDVLIHAVPAFPTRSEIWINLTAALDL